MLHLRSFAVGNVSSEKISSRSSLGILFDKRKPYKTASRIKPLWRGYRNNNNTSRTQILGSFRSRFARTRPIRLSRGWASWKRWKKREGMAGDAAREYRVQHQQPRFDRRDARGIKFTRSLPLEILGWGKFSAYLRAYYHAAMHPCHAGCDASRAQRRSGSPHQRRVARSKLSRKCI